MPTATTGSAIASPVPAVSIFFWVEVSGVLFTEAAMALCVSAISPQIEMISDFRTP
jgi:hypothetical protein